MDNSEGKTKEIIALYFNNVVTHIVSSGPQHWVVL